MCSVMRDADVLLRGAYALVKGSGKKRRQLAALSKEVEETEHALKALANCRWLCRGDCLKRLAEKLEAVILPVAAA